MRILHYINSTGYGGRERYPITIASQQETRGHEVMIAARPSSAMAELLEHESLQFEAVPVHSRIDLAGHKRLSKVIADFGPEIIHLHISADITAAVSACAMAGKSPALVLHQHIGVSSSKKGLLHRFLYSKLKKVIAISQFVKADILRHCPVENSRVEVIWNSLPADQFVPAWELNPERRADIRRELGCTNPDCKLAAVIGRLDPRKGQEIFLRAAGVLAGQGINNFRFAVIGHPEPGEMEKIETLANNLGVREFFHLEDARGDIPEVMASLDMLVVPSYEEAFGLVAAEGMLAGVTVIGADAGALPEIISHGENGFLVPSRAPEKLATQMAEIAGNNQLRERTGRIARDWAAQNLSMDLMLDKLDELYESCV